MAFGHCSHERHHNEEIDESTFEWKGCWNCGILIQVMIMIC